MTRTYYTIQISYSTQDQVEKISISLKSRVRLPGHPQTLFNELPARGSRKGEVDPAIFSFNCKTKSNLESPEADPPKPGFEVDTVENVFQSLVNQASRYIVGRSLFSLCQPHPKQLILFIIPSTG